MKNEKELGGKFDYPPVHYNKNIPYLQLEEVLDSKAFTDFMHDLLERGQKQVIEDLIRS